MKIVSVIIPTFRRTDMLFYELDKLFEQKGVSLDVIVVNDDIKDDPTDEITNKYPSVTYIKSKKKIGPGQKHQLGYKLAKGEYVSFPDDDDYLVDDHFFYKAVNKLEEIKSLSFVSGNGYIRYEDEKGQEIKLEKEKLNVSGFYEGIDFLENLGGKYDKPLSTFPTVFRKKSLDNQNFLNQIEMSDLSIYFLALLGGDAYIMDDYVGVYRVHGQSLTTKKSSPIWILNVLRQKEYIYKKIKNVIKEPDIWWLKHYFITYRFYANTSKNRIAKIKLLLWGLFHSKMSKSFLVCFLKEFCHIIINR